MDKAYIELYDKNGKLLEYFPEEALWCRIKINDKFPVYYIVKPPTPSEKEANDA